MKAQKTWKVRKINVTSRVWQAKTYNTENTSAACQKRLQISVSVKMEKED